MSGIPRVVLHLGSSLSSVQLWHAALGHSLRDQLRRRGVAYVDLDLDLHGAPRAPLATAVARAVADERAVVTAAGGGCRAVFAAADPASGPAGAPAAPERVATLVAALSAATGSDVRIVVAVERQDRVAEHRLVDAARRGDPSPLDAAGPDGAGTPDHAAVIAALRALPGVSSVSARPYELVGAGVAAWVDEALAEVGLRSRLDLRPLARELRAPDPAGPLVPYRTYSPTGLVLARELQQETVTATERRLVHEFVLSAHPGGPHDRLLDDAARQKIVLAHREANAAFFAAHLADLPADSYADDAGTALLGDVLVPARIPPLRLRTRARTIAGRARRAVLRQLRRAE